MIKGIFVYPAKVGEGIIEQHEKLSNILDMFVERPLEAKQLAKHIPR